MVYHRVKGERVVHVVYLCVKGRMDLQKGGYIGSRRRAVIGLYHRSVPTQRKCG
jgi:hypothetical protein